MTECFLFKRRAILVSKSQLQNLEPSKLAANVLFIFTSLCAVSIIFRIKVIIICVFNFLNFPFMQKSMNVLPIMEDASITVTTQWGHTTAVVELAGGCQAIVELAYVCT